MLYAFIAQKRIYERDEFTSEDGNSYTGWQGPHKRGGRSVSAMIPHT